jgi:hypothetical protein
MPPKIETKSTQPQGPSGPSSTANGAAFDQAARRLKREHPDLLEKPEFAKVKAYLAANPSPPPAHGGDHTPNRPRL